MRIGVSTAAVVTVLALGGVSTTGCVTTPTARFADLSDPCYPQREPLLQMEQQLGQSMATGAAVGAAVGIAAALLLSRGEDSRQRRDNVLLGGALGGLTGLAAGYHQGLKQRNLSRAEVWQEINSDAQADAQRFSQTRHVIGSLNQCRSNQIARVQTNYDEGRIGAAEAIKQLASIEKSLAEDNELIRMVLGHADQRSEGYLVTARDLAGRTEQEILGDVKDFRPTSGASERYAGADRPYVATKSANVRTAPGTASTVVGGLQVGERVLVTDRRGDWFQIAFQNQSAFVHSTLLAEDGSEAAMAARLQLAAPHQPSAPRPANGVQAAVVEKRLMEVEASKSEDLLAQATEIRMLLSRRVEPS